MGGWAWRPKIERWWLCRWPYGRLRVPNKCSTLRTVRMWKFGTIEFKVLTMFTWCNTKANMQGVLSSNQECIMIISTVGRLIIFGGYGVSPQAGKLKRIKLWNLKELQWWLEELLGSDACITLSRKFSMAIPRSSNNIGETAWVWKKILKTIWHPWKKERVNFACATKMTTLISLYLPAAARGLVLKFTCSAWSSGSSTKCLENQRLLCNTLIMIILIVSCAKINFPQLWQWMGKFTTCWTKICKETSRTSSYKVFLMKNLQPKTISPLKSDFLRGKKSRLSAEGIKLISGLKMFLSVASIAR